MLCAAPGRELPDYEIKMTKTEFDQKSSRLCGRMVSLDAETRRDAAADASTLLADLPAVLKNSPHCRGEIEALQTLINRVTV